MKNNFRLELQRSPFHIPGGGRGYTVTGIEWELLTTTGTNPAWNAIVRNDSPHGLWVACASAGTGDTATSRVMTSLTGLSGSWTLRATTAKALTGIAYSPTLDLFACCVNLGIGAQIITSPDGFTWTTRTTPAQEITFLDIVWGDERFVAVGAVNNTTGGVGLTMSSTDGLTWAIFNAPNDSQWSSVAYSATLDRYVAVAQAGAGAQSRVMSSDNGTGWSLRATPTTEAWQAVAWCEGLGLFVAGGSNNKVIYSDDGLTWAAGSVTGNPGTSAWSGVVWSPALKNVIMVASSGAADKTCFSPDGINFVTTPAPNSSSLHRGIAWSDAQGKAIAVSATLSGSGAMQTCARFTIP